MLTTLRLSLRGAPDVARAFPSPPLGVGAWGGRGRRRPGHVAAPAARSGSRGSAVKALVATGQPQGSGMEPRMDLMLLLGHLLMLWLHCLRVRLLRPTLPARFSRARRWRCRALRRRDVGAAVHGVPRPAAAPVVPLQRSGAVGLLGE